MAMHTHLPLTISPQPDAVTCGPTCLHSVYRYYGDDISLERVIAETPQLADGGGTLAVMLARHALLRGYSARIYTYNLQLFDPSWFAPGVDMADKLRRQMAVKDDPKLTVAAEAYLEYLELGGKIEYRELRPRMIRSILKKGAPLLTGLSATYLYNSKREHEDEYDDLRGRPAGHFVVLRGYNPVEKTISVADPYHPNPLFPDPYYAVSVQRLIGSILLGILTYDANLLLIKPKKRAAHV